MYSIITLRILYSHYVFYIHTTYSIFTLSILFLDPVAVSNITSYSHYVFSAMDVEEIYQMKKIYLES